MTTTGDEALREAMKHEQARIYGRLCPESVSTHAVDKAVDRAVQIESHPELDVTPAHGVRIADINAARQRRRPA